RTPVEEETVIDEVNHSMFSTMFGQFVNHDLEVNRMVNASSRDYFPLVTYVKDLNDSTCQPTFVPPAEPYRCNPENRVLVVEARISDVQVQKDNTHKVYNDATAYLDLDTVYGRSEAVAKK